MDDQEILERLLNKDEQAFAEFYGSINANLIRVATAICGNRATAEEVAQETWLSVINNLPDFRGNAPLRNWVLTILANKARTRARRDGKSQSLDDGKGCDTEFPADRFLADGSWAEPQALWDRITPERIIEGQETWRLVTGIIATLPPVQQAILSLLEAEKISAAACADILGLTSANVRVQLHRARARIRQSLDQDLTPAKKI